MSSTLRVDPHLRGHIAWCNGSVEKVGAKAEQCRSTPQNATEEAALIEARAKQDRDRKNKELENFRRRVKQRAAEWERTKKQQLAINTTQTVASEQKIVEQAAQLDKRKVNYNTVLVIFSYLVPIYASTYICGIFIPIYLVRPIYGIFMVSNWGNSLAYGQSHYKL